LNGFLKKVPPRIIVVLDQAYFEYACDDPEYPDGLALRARFPNLVVTRTFSKAYGLAGLRIGYAVARPEIVRDLDRVRPPFNANRMAQAAALAALGDGAHLRRSVRVNAAGMKQLVNGFKQLGIGSWPSHANFILVDLHGDARQAFENLLKVGVVTRPMSGYGLTSCLRISIGTREENRRCLAGLGRVLAGMRKARA
jgi:histidinol-phosphate aminotransferase